MDFDNQSTDRRFHQLGRIMAVLPRLQAKGTDERYRETLDRLATKLQEMAGAGLAHQTSDGWANQVLKDWGLGDRVETGLPGPPLPDDAVLYAEDYLEQRRELQGNRPPAPPEEENSTTTGTITWAASCPGRVPATTPTWEQGSNRVWPTGAPLNPGRRGVPQNTTGNSPPTSKAPGEPR